MRINSLKLKNFRCYSSKEMAFSTQRTVLVGANAIGKTSIIESIYLLSIGKSPRTSIDSDLIKNGENAFFVAGNFETKTSRFNVSISFEGNHKCIKKERNLIKRLSDYLGTVDVVWFSSDDLKLISGTPMERRISFDRIICQISKVYYDALSNYKKVLKERNALLKRLIFENNSKNRILLDVLSEKLIKEGKTIISIRSKIAKKISSLIAEKHCLIGSKEEIIELKYLPSIDINNYETRIKDSFNEDIERGNTSFGPHKDDYIFIINNKNIASQGSQGQQRNAILALKLAEVNLIYEVKKEYPILLLDDVFSELDKQRQNNLMNGLDKDVQTIITTTTISDIDKDILQSSNVVKMERRD